MSAERSQDLLQPPATARKAVEVPRAALLEELLGGDQRLADALHRRRKDPFSLVAYLRALSTVERHRARLLLVRELGAERAQAVCEVATGGLQLLLPPSGTAEPEPNAPPI